MLLLLPLQICFALNPMQFLDQIMSKWDEGNITHNMQDFLSFAGYWKVGCGSAFMWAVSCVVWCVVRVGGRG